MSRFAFCLSGWEADFDAITLIAALSSRAPIQQQNAALILGCVDFFSENRHRLLVVVQRLITFSGNDVSLRRSSFAAVADSLRSGHAASQVNRRQAKRR